MSKKSSSQLEMNTNRPLVRALAVVSADGFLEPADSRPIHDWASPEDGQHFFGRVNQATGIIMGRKTWQQNQAVIQLRPETLRTVMTRQPESLSEYSVDDQLIFSSDTPQQLLDSYRQRGDEEVLLVGGGEVYGLFLKAGLVDVFELTREPVFFGSGRSLVTTMLRDIDLELLETSVLNRQGTLLMTYNVR